MSPPWESRQQYKWRHHNGEIDAIIVNRSDETEMIVSGYQYIVAEIKRDLKKTTKNSFFFLKVILFIKNHLSFKQFSFENTIRIFGVNLSLC